MSLRTLPAAPILSHRTIGNRGAVGLDAAPPSAFDRWDISIRAANGEGDNVVSILGVIGEDFFGTANNTARRVGAALRSIGARDITVHIHSPGGDFFEGLAIYNLLREHKAKVTVKVLGLAASAASIIAMAGDEIQMPKAGFLMLHNTQAVTIGDRHDHQKTFDLLEPFDASLAEIYAARTETMATIIARMLDEGTWITGEVAIEKGFADALLPADETVKDTKLAARLAPSKGDNRLDAIVALATGKSRSDRRKEVKELLNEIRGGKPGAALTGMPGAADQESPLGDVLSALRSMKIP